MAQLRTNLVLFLAPALALGCQMALTVAEPNPPSVSTSTAGPVFGGTAIQADTPPPPLVGGTVRIIKTFGRAFAVASNADEDSIHVVSLTGAPSLLATIALRRGDEPNRIVGDGHGQAHVILRGGSAIATIDLATATLVSRRNVCPAPRGIDYDAASDMLYVACATGELVTLGATGPVVRTVRLARDLRDVIVEQGQVYVSRFRSAELLTVDGSGTVIASNKPGSPDTTLTGGASMESIVAWRTVHTPGGGTPTMLHQVASNEPLAVVPLKPYYAETTGVIVAAALTSSGQPPVPLGINQTIDVTFDGAGQTEAMSLLGTVQLGSRTYATVELSGTVPEAGGAAPISEFTGIDDGSGVGVPWIVAMQRSPTATLVGFASAFAANNPFPTPDFTLPLSQKSHVDTGFDIFHLPTSIGTACMNCHPEGGDDGHSWTFAITDSSGSKETRLRRTQSLQGGVVTGSAPYHWDGDLTDQQTLSNEVFTHRMGGGEVTATQAPILARWLDSIPRVPPRGDLDGAAVAYGKAIFEGRGACVQCHNGPYGTLVANQDIGKVDALGSSKALQVPMLLGVGGRAPYMHDGCAATLMDRLTNAACAGSKHGNTASLSASDLRNLETYLESL